MSWYRMAKIQKVPIQLYTVIKSVTLTRLLSIEVKKKVSVEEVKKKVN